jgi:ribosomal protein S18 acetylase RimI-like enzyme
VVIEPGVRRATLADAGPAADTLAAALSEDPTVVWAIPDSRRRLDIMRDFYRLFLERTWIRDGIVELAGDGAAVAVWLASDATAPSTQEMAALEAGVQRVTGEFAWRVAVVFEVMGAAHPTVTHAYLPWIGTCPERQGEGLGSRLLRQGLARSDAAGTPVYLDASAPRNRVLYERHGFRVTHEHRLPDGPTFWGMWRDPSTLAANDRR